MAAKPTRTSPIVLGTQEEKEKQVNELTANQIKNPPVGSAAAVFTPFAGRLERPWTVLAMSDGVWKYVGWERVRAIQRNNPELLAGDKGARKAHALYVRQILEMAGSDGLANRLRAIRALEKLRKRAKAMFNDVAADAGE